MGAIPMKFALLEYSLNEENLPTISRTDFDDYHELINRIKDPYYAEGVCPYYAVVCSNREGIFVEDVDYIQTFLRVNAI